MVEAGYAPAQALRKSRVFSSYDVDYAREQISAILQPHQLIPTGKRSAPQCYADHLQIGALGIGALHFGQAQVTVPAIADYHLLIICQEGSAHIRMDQREFEIGGSRALLVTPGARMHASFSSDCEQFFLRLPTATLKAHSSADQLEFDPEVDLGASDLAPFLSQLALISSNCATVGLLKANEIIRVEYERMLVAMLLAGQPHRSRAAVTNEIAPRCVKQAEAYIRANYDQPLTLDAISRAANVSPRTLLSSFRQFRDTSPIRYLRDVRLEHARTVLRTIPGISISSVAMDAGFTHLGRFSIAYAERFKERPSDTAKGSRRSLANA